MISGLLRSFTGTESAASDSLLTPHSSPFAPHISHLTAQCNSIAPERRLQFDPDTHAHTHQTMYQTRQNFEDAEHSHSHEQCLHDVNANMDRRLGPGLAFLNNSCTDPYSTAAWPRTHSPRPCSVGCPICCSHALVTRATHILWRRDLYLGIFSEYAQYSLLLSPGREGDS